MGNFVSKTFSGHILEALIDHSFDGIGIVDRNGIIKYTSDTTKKILGFDPEKMMGKKIFEFIDVQDLPILKEVIRPVLRSERKFINTKLRLKHANGKTVECEVNIKNLLRDKAVSGIVVYYHKTTKNIKSKSIEKDELLVCYQSKITIENNEFVENEGLIKRGHPELGQIIDSINQIDIMNKDIRKKIMSMIKQNKTCQVAIPLRNSETRKRTKENSTKENLLREWKLTRREIEVLDYVTKGCSNKEIAGLLHISDHTVKNHMTKILRKLDVSDRSQAIAKIYQMEFNN